MATNILFEFEESLTGVQGAHRSVSTLADSELERWTGKKETDPSVFDTLKKYWDYVNFGNDWSPSETP